MTALECMVVGCGSSAYAIPDLTPNREWASLPGEVLMCNFHKDELEKNPEWVLVRDERRVYVGDSLRNLNEYIVLGVEGITGYGTAREFSNPDHDGHHLKLKVRRRGDKETEMVLVIPSQEIAKELKKWVGYIPTD